MPKTTKTVGVHPHQRKYDVAYGFIAAILVGIAAIGVFGAIYNNAERSVYLDRCQGDTKCIAMVERCLDNPDCVKMLDGLIAFRNAVRRDQ